MNQMILDKPVTIPGFIKGLEEQQLFLTEQKGELILKAQTGQFTADDIARIKEDTRILDFIREHKAQLIEYINSGNNNFSNLKVDLEKISSIYELSPLQEGMLFHDLYDRELNTYTEQFKVDFPFGVDKNILRQSLEFILHRHTILRSSFIYDKLTVPVQCVYKKVELPFFELDVSGFKSADQEIMIEEFYKKDRKQGFDFEHPPLMRISLIAMGAEKYRMVWTYNHILIDGWSLQVLVGELLNTYQVFSKGGSFPGQDTDKYEDFIKYIKSRNLEDAKLFWTKYLEGFEAPTLLPFLDNRKESTKGRGVAEELYLEFDEKFTAEITNYVQQNFITVSTLIQGVWSFLLSKYSGSDDTVIGITVSGRPTDLKNAEERVGLYINALPVRSKIKQYEKIADWLANIQKDHTQAREYQYNSLNDIQRWSGIEGSLFDNIIVFEKYPVGELLSQDWVLKAGNAVSRTQNNYTLSIKVSSGNRLSIVFSYYEKFLNKVYAEMIREHFGHVLKQIVSRTSCNIGELKLLTADEQKKLVSGFNNTSIEIPANQTFLDLFYKQVRDCPQLSAISFANSHVSYEELDKMSDQLANYLLYRGLQKNACVGICMHDHFDKMVISILGVLKAGAAYLPVDPEIPNERMGYILNEAKVNILITHKTCAIHQDTEDRVVIFVDTEWENIRKMPEAKPVCGPLPENLAYVIYTSGSTGKPKGVMVSHHNLLDYLLGFSKKIPIPASSKYGLMSTFSADLGNTILFGSLINGGTLHLFTKNNLSDVEYLHDYFSRNNIDVIKIVPSHWKALESEKGLLLPAQTLIFGGEELNPKYLQRIHDVAPDLEIYNHYGPTETTIGKLIYKIDNKREYLSIPLGNVFSNSRAYVVAKDFSICPVGVKGELLLGGQGVSKGYLEQPGLTSERFIQDPFLRNEKTLVYRTGDMVRRLPDGNIQFHGRADNQIKIRGYRIEIGEIEAALDAATMVKQSVVMTKEDSNGDACLVAYVVPQKKYSEAEVKAFLMNRLPSYMIPSCFMELNSIPLTANGKIDRKALAKMEMHVMEKSKSTELLSEQESKLLQIWKDILKTEKIGIEDDFFELGGHSLTAIRLIGRINKVFSVKVPIGAIYTHSTVASQAREFLSAATDKDESKLIAVNKNGDKKPVFFIPGSTGNTLVYEALGKQVGNQQPFYAIQPKGFNGKSTPFGTIEEMAADFIKLIQQVDPIGPYCLGGYSFGGHVAYEMAVQLRRKGFKISRLVILDSLSPVNKIINKKNGTYEEWICSSVAIYEKYYGINISISDIELKGLTRAQQLAIVASKLKGIGLDIPVEQLNGFINISLTNELMLDLYTLNLNEKLDAALYLFKCTENDPERLIAYGEQPFQKEDLGWGELVMNQVTIHTVPGNHHTFLFSPNVETLAELLKPIL